MKILLNTHPTAFQNMGGAELKVMKTKQYMEKRGYKPKVFNLFEDKIMDYDVIHNFTMNIDCFTFCAVTKSLKKPLLLSTIYWDMKQIHKQGKKVNLNDRLISVSSRVLNTASNIDKYTLNLFVKSNMVAKLYPYRKYMQLADVLLPNSHAEADILIKKFQAKKRKIKVIHNAVEHHFSKTKPKLFRDKYGLRDYVLFVGRIDYRKNVLPLVKACKELGLELVIIGSPLGDTDDKYYKLCKKAAGKKVHFLPGMPYGSDMLKSAYANAKVVALPSWFETPGNTVLEGGLAGANIVVTSVGSTKEYFDDMAWYVNPNSYEDIKKKIADAYNASQSTALKKHLMKNFTWEAVARKTEKAYNFALEKQK